MCCKQIRWRRLLDKVMRARAADRIIKCSYTKPPRSNIYMTQRHFSSIFPMIAEEALGYFSDSQWGRKPILSGLQGTWRAIKQPDIFLVNHQQKGELLRVQLTTSRSDFSRELALKKILRQSFSLLFFLPLSSQLHTLTRACSISFTLLSSPPHTFIVTPSFPSHRPSEPPSSPLVSITDKRYFVVGGDTISCPVLNRAENRSQVCRGWEPWILILRQ